MGSDGSVQSALAVHLRTIRNGRSLSLQDLSSKSGVSRATLSRIENAEVSPTAETLGRLAAAFALPLSQLLAPLEPRFSALVRRESQSLWQDPSHGYTRRTVSPPSSQLRLEIVEGELKPHQRIVYEQPSVPDHEHHLVLLTGALVVIIGDIRHELRPGDCLRYRLQGPSSFATDEQSARYLIALA